MRMLINNAGSNMFSGSINDPGTRFRQIFTNSSNLSILQQNVCILQNTFRFICPYCCVPDQYSFLPGSLVLFPAKWFKRKYNFAKRTWFSYPSAVGFCYCGPVEHCGPGDRVACSIH